jgi:hypothetical protein
MASVFEAHGVHSMGFFLARVAGAERSDAPAPPELPESPELAVGPLCSTTPLIEGVVACGAGRLGQNTSPEWTHPGPNEASSIISTVRLSETTAFTLGST